MDSSLMLWPPLWFGEGAKFSGWGAPEFDKFCIFGGTELFLVWGLWSSGYRCTLFLLFFLWIVCESSISSKLSTPIIFWPTEGFIWSSLAPARYFLLRSGIISLLFLELVRLLTDPPPVTFLDLIYIPFPFEESLKLLWLILSPWENLSSIQD